MNIDDIEQLVLLCAVIFFPSGYYLHRRFPYWIPTLQAWLLSPRHLKSAGIWKREDDVVNKKKSS